MSAIPSYAHVPAARNAAQQYDLAFQVSPIVLQDGIAANAEGKLLPIIALYNQTAQMKTTSDPNEFFAKYFVLPGGTLVSNAIGTYPFANAVIAANAVVKQALNISMLMIAPVSAKNPLQKKLATFAALQKAIQQHCASGGRFTIATPAAMYEDCLLTAITDVSHSEVTPQIMFQWDFVQPLLTLAAAAAAQQQLIQKLTNGGQIKGQPTWSGDLQASSTSANGLNAALQTFGGDLRPAAGTPESPQGNVGVGS